MVVFRDRTGQHHLLDVEGVDMAEESNKGQRDQKQGSMIGPGIGVGIAIGAGLGVAMDNIAIGVAIGLCVGVAMGAAFEAARKRRGGTGGE